MIAHDPINLRRRYFKNALSSDSLLGDWATTPENGIFTISESSMRIFSLWIEMRLSATVNPDNFGTVSALTTGLTFTVERNGTPIHTIFDAVKKNEDFEPYFQRQNSLSDKSFMGPYLVYIGYGGPISQRFSRSDKIVITSNENLTSVASKLRFSALGLIGQD